MLLKIDSVALDRAAQALMIAAKSATDQDGLKVLADTPRSLESISPDNGFRDINDWKRIRAIALGALVALVNGAVVLSDEAPS